MQIRRLTSRLAAAIFSLSGSATGSEPDADERLWQSTYAARQQYFEKTVGPFPEDILKMLNMTGVWPGGGLFILSAPRIGEGLSVYTSFGLTNPDMPTSVQARDVELSSDENGATRSSSTLQRKEPAPKKPGSSGYGYEIVVITQSGQRWPLGFLQWAVTGEIGHDFGFLAHVEKYDGLTVEQIEVGEGEKVNVLIAKAEAPLPTGTDLPSGKMEILVATVITDQEMQWSQVNGRGALLRKLQDAGIGQTSILGRQSVVE